MNRILEIQNLCVVNNSCTLLKNINLIFYEGINVFICGTSGSGKTCILNTILGELKYKGQIIKYNDKIEIILNKIEISSKTIKEELNYDILADNKKKIVDKFISKVNLNKRLNEISESLEKLILVCKSLIKEPKIIFVDNIFSFMDEKDLKKIYSYTKKNKITIVNVSNNIEEALKYDYMIVLDKGQIVMEGKTEQILLQEKILKRLGIGLPFYIDLSIQLKLYGLIDNIRLSKEDLVEDLWK